MSTPDSQQLTLENSSPANLSHIHRPEEYLHELEEMHPHANHSTLCVERSKVETAHGRLGACPHLFHRPLSFLRWTYELLFGLASVILLLAVLAAIPIINLYVLGYFLEVQRRMATKGTLHGVLPLLDVAPRLGSIALFIWLMLLPLRFISGFAIDAEIISPDTTSSRAWMISTNILAILLFIHFCLALARGGAWYTFLSPVRNLRWLLHELKQGTYLTQAATHLYAFLGEFKIREFYSLGLRGFLGAAIWILPPTILFAVFSTSGKGEVPQGIITILGGIWLGFILARLPAIQTHFVVQNRFRAWFETSPANRNLQHTPLLWLLATVFFYVLMLPLYLFKIVALPQDALWMVTLIFVTAILPSKLLVGWVYYFSSTRQQRPAWYWRRPLRLLIYPLCWLYVFILFFTQFIDERGPTVLFQNHAFLLPF